MLDGLDQIDWKSLGYHVYGRNETIPDEIRNLLSPDPHIREAALGFLLGSQQDFGDIYDTTPHIIPFLIELLAFDETHAKAELLRHLSVVAQGIFHSRHLSIHMMQLNLRTYNAFKVGLNILISLLGDTSSTVRLSSANVLQYMTDEVEFLIPELIRRFRHEQDEETRIALLSSLKTLLRSLEWPRYDLKEQCVPFLKEVVEAKASYRIRVAAARASVELVHPILRYYGKLSPQVPVILAKEFLEHASPLDEWEQAHTSLHATKIMIDLARLEPEALLDLLQDPTINAEVAHLIARGLLAHTLLYSVQLDPHFEHFPSSVKKGEGMIYLQHDGAVWHIYPQTMRILQAIVDADRVWDTRTNLFSFFYGLPDSREGLRALLSQQGDT